MDPTFLVLVLGLGVFIIFQVFQGRKRRAETLDRQTKFVPGVEIMTNYGLYGTILDLDDETNVVTIESTPGTVLKIHRQTILKVADYAVVADADLVDDSTVGDVDALGVDRSDSPEGTPSFGVRSVDSPALDGTPGPGLDRDGSRERPDSGSPRGSRPLDDA